MDLWSLIWVVVRRWYASLPALALTGLVIVGIMSTTPPLYGATASGILVMPSTQVFGKDEIPVNPYLSMTGSLQVAGAAVTRILDSEAVRERFADDGLVDDYEISIDQMSPFITVYVEGTDPDVVLASMNEVVDAFGARLDALQDDVGAPTDQRIHLQEVTRPVEASELSGTGLRVMVALGVLGLGAAVGLALLAETVANRAARNRHRDDFDGPPTWPDEPVVPVDEPDLSSSDEARERWARARLGS